MPRFSIVGIAYVVAVVAGLFAFLSFATRFENSFAGWLLQSLGLIYVVAFTASGALAVFVAFRSCKRSRTPSEVAVGIPVTVVPIMVGVIGLLHGYVSLYRVIGMPKLAVQPINLYDAAATILACPMIGLLLSCLTFTPLAIAMVVKQRFDRDVAVLNGD